jgi:hypothetical protein
MALEGIQVGALALPPPEYDEGDQATRWKVVEQFMEDVNAWMQQRSDVTNTLSGFTFMPATTRWFRAGVGVGAVAVSAAAITEDRLYLRPFVPHATVTLTELAVSVTTGAASSTMRIGLYDTTDWLTPDALLAETSDLDTSTTGVKSETISQEVTAGQVYWAGCAAQAGTPTVRTDGGSDYHTTGVASATSALDTAARTGAAYIDIGASWTSLPDPVGSVTWAAPGGFPLIAIEVT